MNLLHQYEIILTTAFYSVWVLKFDTDMFLFVDTCVS